MTNEKYIVVALKSKVDVFSMIDELLLSGVRAETTPNLKETKTGCGIAVKAPLNSLHTIIGIIEMGGYKSINGVFLVERQGQRTSRRKIY